MSPFFETSVTVVFIVSTVAGAVLAGIAIAPIFIAIVMPIVNSTVCVAPFFGVKRSLVLAPFPAERSVTVGAAARAGEDERSIAARRPAKRIRRSSHR